MISLIACISSNGALGNKQQLLFHIKEDLQRFKSASEGQIVVMGMRTFESIIEMNGKPLPNRINVVLTKNEDYVSQYGEIVFNSVEKIISHHATMGDKDKKIIVAGGNSVYKEFLPYTNEVLLTIVNKHIENADTFFPIEYQEKLGFSIIEQSEEFYTEKYDAYYKFVRYVKSETIEEGE